MKNANRIIRISIASLALIIAIVVIFAQINKASAKPIIDTPEVEEIVLVEEEQEQVQEEQVEQNDITVTEASALLVVAVEEPQVKETSVVEADSLKEVIKNGLAQVKAVYQEAVKNIDDYDVRHQVDTYYPVANRYIADINEGDDYELIINTVVNEFKKEIVKVAGNVIDLSVDAYKALAFELVDAKVEQFVVESASDEIISSFYEAEFAKISTIDSVETGKLILTQVLNDVK